MNKQELTPRERLLRTLQGLPCDRVPFSPLLAYYFESLPKEVQARGMLAYLEEIGADPLLRGAGFAWKKKSRRCQVEESVEGYRRTVVTRTPFGELRAEYTFVPQSNTWFLTKHPVETQEDCKRLACYYEDLVIESDAAAWDKQEQEIGQRALMLPLVGVEMKTAFQALIENQVGTENLVYLVEDHPQTVGELLQVMQHKNAQTVRCTLESGAQAALFWEDSSTTNVSPKMYQTYIAPEITDWAEQYRKAGRLLIQHACGHVKDLLPLMCAQGIACIESLSPLPTGNVTMEEAFARTPPEMAIIGGIDAVTLLHAPVAELEQEARRLLHLAQGRRFVLSNSDSCPPGVEEGKFRMLSRLVREWTDE